MTTPSWVKNCDAFFMQASRVSVAETAERVARVKELARQHGREISVYTVGVITCRPTMQEAARKVVQLAGAGTPRREGGR